MVGSTNTIHNKERKEGLLLCIEFIFLKEFFFCVCLLVFICRYRLVYVKEDSGK